jgi:mannose-6-phosphate isomerase class I
VKGKKNVLICNDFSRLIVIKNDLHDIRDKNVEEFKKKKKKKKKRNGCTYLLSFDLFSFRYNNLWKLLVRLKRTPHKQLSPNLE